MTMAAAERSPTVGERAPDFTLESTSGERVTLSSVTGRQNVLIAFVPLAFTSTCTAEFCDISTDFDQFAWRRVAVLPISVDSVPTLREYKAKYAMRVDFLSDFRREAAGAYGVLLPDKFYAARSYFLVDTDGIVRWAHTEANPGMKRGNEELIEQIDALA